MTAPGFIYAVECSGRIKIGWSKDPTRRLTKLATDCPFEVALIGIATGSQADEKALHIHLSHWRRAREWFEKTPEVMDALSFLKPPLKPFERKVKSRGHPVGLFRVKNNLSQRELGDIVGCCHSTIALIESRKRYPSSVLLRKLCRASGLTANAILEIESGPSP